MRDERGDEHYRLTRKADGRTWWCDRYGNDGGDVIDLVRELEPDTPFVDAVYRLLGGRGPTTPGATPPHRTARLQRYPRLERGGAQAVAAGRAYLRGKHLIDDASIAHAEGASMLGYDPEGRLLFTGHDEHGRVRNVTRQATHSRESVQKRDLRGSDKAFPPILPGDKGASVLIVASGVDAIAAHAEARTKGQVIPQIIVSGGCGVRSFLENRQVQQLLREAPRITIACDNATDPAIQRRVDAQYAEQQKVVSAFNPEVRLWHPPAELHGVADWWVANELKRREAKEEREAQLRVAAMEAEMNRRHGTAPPERTRGHDSEDRIRRDPWMPNGPKGPGM